MRCVFSTVVNTLICVTQLGACTAYVLFIAQNLNDVSKEEKRPASYRGSREHHSEHHSRMCKLLFERTAVVRRLRKNIPLATLIA